MKSLLAVVANNSIATTMVFVKSRPRLFFFSNKKLQSTCEQLWEHVFGVNACL